MPVLGHTAPCRECPLRRDSAPGWLGADDPKSFIESVLGEVAMPCHMAIDYEKENWREEQLPTAPICAGSLVFLHNTCALPRDKDLRVARSMVTADPENVFSNKNEFLEHHKK